MSSSKNDAYGTTARFYDRLLEPMNAPLRAIGLKMYPPDPSMTVLDVGCGTGAHLEAYVDTGATCHGIDMSQAMLEQAHIRLGDGAELLHGDATHLPYDDDRFDLVFTSLILHEMDPSARSAILAEMARVVTPDGRILIIDYRTGPRRTKGHVRRVLSIVAERVAGTDHYRNWRKYLRAGGIPEMLEGTDLLIEQEKIVSGGNLALWLLEKT